MSKKSCTLAENKNSIHHENEIIVFTRIGNPLYWL